MQCDRTEETQLLGAGRNGRGRGEPKEPIENTNTDDITPVEGQLCEGIVRGMGTEVEHDMQQQKKRE